MTSTQRTLPKNDPLIRSGANCPFCGFPFHPGDNVVLCPADNTPHHVVCWQQNGNRCTTLGCAGSGEVLIPVVLTAASSSRTIIPFLAGGIVTLFLVGTMIVGVVLLGLAKFGPFPNPTLSPTQPSANTRPTPIPTVPSSVVFSSDFGNGKTQGWIPITGIWTVRDNVYSQEDVVATAAKSMVRLSNLSCYSYELRARTVGGREGFLIIFNFQGRYVWWNIGGWDNAFSMVEGIDRAEETRTNDSITYNQWYSVKIAVDNDQATGWLNGIQRWRARRSVNEIPGLPNDGWRGIGMVGLIGVGTWNARAL